MNLRFIENEHFPTLKLTFCTGVRMKKPSIFFISKDGTSLYDEQPVIQGSLI